MEKRRITIELTESELQTLDMALQNLDDCTREWAKGFTDKQREDYGVNDILSDIGSISDKIYKYV
jgi:DNA-binding MarR family transcriptional regulator